MNCRDLNVFIGVCARAPFKAHPEITNLCLRRVLERADTALSSLCHGSLFIGTLEDSYHKLNY